MPQGQGMRNVSPLWIAHFPSWDRSVFGHRQRLHSPLVKPGRLISRVIWSSNYPYKNLPSAAFLPFVVAHNMSNDLPGQSMFGNIRISGYLTKAN
jgi:hypothetical protein